MSATGREHVLARCTSVVRTFAVGPSMVVALQGVSCEILAGQRISITGPSGSGKSTLLHVLAGLDDPSAGNVEWPAIGPRAHLRPGPVAMVFQGPSLLPPLDVIENVALPLLLAGEGDAEARHAAHQALVRLSLADLAGKLPEELSGGQAQRAAVARALAGRPQLILADEPTGQLDRATASGVMDALVDTAGALGAALVVTTHDRAVAARMDIRWTMVDGALVDPYAA